MTALAKDRNTKRRAGQDFTDPLAASTKIYAGALVCINAAGYAVPGATSTTLKARAAGALLVDSRRGCFPFVNSAAADEITRADIGATAYIVDDQTVAKTNGTNTRSAAGVIRDLDSDGVWVEI